MNVHFWEGHPLSKSTSSFPLSQKKIQSNLLLLLFAQSEGKLEVIISCHKGPVLMTIMTPEPTGRVSQKVPIRLDQSTSPDEFLPLCHAPVGPKPLHDKMTFPSITPVCHHVYVFHTVLAVFHFPDIRQAPPESQKHWPVKGTLSWDNS